ncbi:MAG: Crp/Fnr family transcriptional regulator [Elusimicrobiota bacterium]
MKPFSLKKIPLLRSLNAQELERVQTIAKPQNFASGSIIIKKAEKAQHMFMVLSGRVKIFCYSNARKRKTFAYLGAGDFFGEMAVIVDRERSASVEAVEDCSLIIIKKDDFRKLLLSDAKLCFNLLKAVSDRLRRADDEIESLLFRNILGRVAKTINDLSKSGGARRFRKGVILRQKYTHQDLADLVGTTREPLSRALAMLRRAELVDSHKGMIHILDPKKLQSLIHTSVGTA